LKADYWDVTDEQVIEKTGQSLTHWRKILDEFGAAQKKSNEVVAHPEQTWRAEILRPDTDDAVPEEQRLVSAPPNATDVHKAKFFFGT
jgi:hypothetical protein